MAIANFKVGKAEAGIFKIYADSHEVKIDQCYQGEDEDTYIIYVKANTYIEIENFAEDVDHISLRTL